MKIRPKALLAGHLASIAGTLLIVAPAEAGRGDVAFRPERSIAASIRLARQEWRSERTHQRQLLRASGLPTLNSTEQSKDSILIDDLRGQIRSRDLTHFINSSDRIRALTRGLELDLTSSERSIIVGQDLFDRASSYTLITGGVEKVVSAGSRISPAEFVALQQVVAGGKQELVLDSSGRGVDGKFSIDSISDGAHTIHAKSLVIPTSVDAIGDLSRSSDFRLTGDFTNNGNVYLNGQHNGSSIAARNLTNTASATISSLDDLNLSASRDLNNDGVISSAGRLTVSAGNKISNSGSMVGKNELNISSPTVSNSGVLTTQGNINIDTPFPSSINIDSTGGTVSATGDINFRSWNTVDKVDTTLTGGEWLSSNLKIYSGDGHVNVNANDITGGITVHSGTAIINSKGDNLSIQELKTTGDPLISNYGSVTLSYPATNGNPLSVIAGKNIVLASTVNTSSTTGDAGDVLMIAGADFSITGNTLQVNGASATGGNITGSGSIIATSSTGEGGNVVLAAFAASGSNGLIDISGSSSYFTDIRVTGGAGKSNGSVTVIAPTRIFALNIYANGAGTSAAGDVLVSASQPEIAGTLKIDTTTGAVLSGAIVPGAPGKGVINLGIVEAGQAAVFGDSIQIGSMDASNVDLAAYSNIALLQVSTPVLTMNMLGPGTAFASSSNNKIGAFYSFGEGKVQVGNSEDLLINSLGPTQSLEAASLTSVIIGADITTTGDTTFNTTKLVNNFALSAKSIRVFSPVDSVVVDGGTGGSFTATGANEKVTFGSWLGGITLEGKLNFGSEAEFTVSSSPSAVTIATGANVTGQDAITINAQNVVLNSSITAKPLVINYDSKGGTIVNSEGDLVLTGPIVMNGGDLAFLAKGNIISSGPLTINLSSTSSDGGSLFLWSGVYTYPGTPGQIVDSFTKFKDFGVGYPGSVLLADVNIDTSSLNGKGGNVIAIANSGTVTLGSINASGTTEGGAVRLYSDQSVTVGDISATGAKGGSVEIQGSAPLSKYPPSFYILNGSFVGEIFPSTYAPTGSVNVGAVNVGNGSVLLKATDLKIGNALIAHTLDARATNSIDVTAVPIGISLLQDTAGNGGTLRLESQNIIFNSSATTPFVLRADGIANGNGGSITVLEYGDVTPTYVGNVPKALAGSQFLEIYARSGSGTGGNGGYISLQTSGEVSIDTSKFSAAPLGSGPSDGAQYIVNAGGGLYPDGELVLIGDLRADGINGGAGGHISLFANSKLDFVLNSMKAPKNGVSGILTASGLGGSIDVSNYYGSIVVKTTEALQTSKLYLADGLGGSTKPTSISVDRGAVLTADEISLVSGSIKESKKVITVDTKKLTVFNSIGAVENVGTAALTLNGSLYSSDFSLLSKSSINVFQLSADDGSIDLTSTKGSITLLGDVTNPGYIKTTNGDITILSKDVNIGTIELGLNSAITTTATSRKGGGDITLAVGKIVNGKHTAAPTNVNVLFSGGKVFFEPGPGVVDAQGSPTYISAQYNRRVVISSTTSQKIHFNGDNRIYALNPTSLMDRPAVLKTSQFRSVSPQVPMSLTRPN